MGLKLLERYFGAVVLALVAAVAWFQAQATTLLFSRNLGPDEKTLTRAPTPAPTATSPVSSHRAEQKSADPILSRNVFDSVTGPLDKVPLGALDLEAAGPVDTHDPLSAPSCSGVKVQIVTESTDPQWSLAAMQGPGDPKPKMRRVGDGVGDKQVVYIGYNPKQTSPAVWLAGGSALCQAVLFSKENAAATPGAGASPAAGAPLPGANIPGAPPPVPADIKNKIQRVSETEFNVDRSVVNKILENQADLMKTARIVPEQKDGKVVGIRLFGIRPDTLLGTLGFQNGDRLETINGFDMASPEKALEAYARLRTASSLSVKINRRGQPTNIDFRIK